ncbi:MAG: glycoside hydrolase family 15 protein [Boseongicola sp.]|nr:glycoside hydrolase family 15 protein [Boseongicola sp.]
MPEHSNSNGQLDLSCDLVEEAILSRQNPVTGLFPASTAVLASGDYSDAWVRDNIYGLAAIWALLKALQRVNYRPKRQARLAQAVQSCMQGLLRSMRQQCDNIEAFKRSRDHCHAVHAKFALGDGGAVVANDAWGHLQLDSKALYVLNCAQFTAGGLNIVNTEPEFALLQNLVHYISAAASTPDFGVWERGRKTNHGQPEVNNSSVGLALAALRAAQRAQFSITGPDGREIRHLSVSEDDMAMMLDRLDLLLPDESLSKAEDAALLSVIGYPGFAPLDQERLDAVRAHLNAELRRSHGYLRFHLDGHQSWFEDRDRLHYNVGELAKFRGWEAQWPLFHAFSYLDANIRGAEEEVAEHRRSLESALVGDKDEVQIPELYFAVPDQGMRNNANVPLVWTASLYLAGRLVEGGWILPKDLDPLALRSRDGAFKASPKVQILEEAPLDRPHWLDLRRTWQDAGASCDLGLTGRSSDALGLVEILKNGFVHEAELENVGGAEILRKALLGATTSSDFEICVLRSAGCAPAGKADTHRDLNELEHELARFAVQRLVSLGAIVRISDAAFDLVEERHPSHARLCAWLASQRSRHDFRPARLAIQLMFVSLARVDLFATDLVLDLSKICDMSPQTEWTFDLLLNSLEDQRSELRVQALGLPKEFYVRLHSVLAARSSLVIGAPFDQENWLNARDLSSDCRPGERLFRREVNARLAKIQDLDYRARTIAVLGELDEGRSESVIFSDDEVNRTRT